MNLLHNAHGYAARFSTDAIDFRWYKMENIINRGGGDLKTTLYNCVPEDFADKEGGLASKSGKFADTPVTVTIDGGKVTLKPGQSITLLPCQYHS